jgi:Zn-dependent peptidase ImmA (M78 family)
VRRREGLAEARRHARRLHGRFGICKAEHVRVEAIADYLGVEIREGVLDGATAQLVQYQGRKVILLSNRVVDPRAHRFSIAHELGHLVLRHQSSPQPGTSWPTAQGRPRRDHEAEANAFAAELLMPSALLRRRCEVAPVSLQVPRQIAEEFNVSLPASAIRFAELASEKCAAVMSLRGSVRWAASSATFRHRIARGARVQRNSLAGSYFASGAVVDDPQEVPPTAWIDKQARRCSLVEHASSTREYGTVLSMLWMPQR